MCWRNGSLAVLLIGALVVWPIGSATAPSAPTDFGVGVAAAAPAPAPTPTPGKQIDPAPKPKVRGVDTPAPATSSGEATYSGKNATFARSPKAPNTTLTVGPNINITKRAGNESEAAIVINPANPLQVVMSSNRAGSGPMNKAVSADGGLTWTNGAIATGTDGLPTSCCDPTLAADRFGNIYLSYITGSPFATIVAISSNGGVTFTLLTTLDSSGTDQPTIVTGPSSNPARDLVCVSYNDSGPMAVRCAESTGPGAVTAFNGPFVVPGSSGGSFGDIVIGPNGKVLIAYEIPSSGIGPADIQVNLKANGADSNPFGSAIIATSTNVGGFAPITPQPNRTVDAEAGLAWDRSGGPFHNRLYLMYNDRPNTSSSDTNVFLRTSTDNGSTWSAPVRVDDAGAADGRAQFLPRIAMDHASPVGAFAVTWHDAREDAGNTLAKMYGTVSVDGGATFMPNVAISAGASNGTQPVSGNGIEFGDYTGLTFHGGVFLPVWADNSNSTGDNPNGTLAALDIYTARVVVSGVPGTLGPVKFLANPVRVADTRPLYVNNFSGVLGGSSPTGFDQTGAPTVAGPFGANETRRFKIGGQSFGSPLTAIPASATGVLVNVTIVQPPGAGTGGFTVIYPGNANTPTAATVNPADPVSPGLLAAVNQNFAVVALAPITSTVAVNSVGQAGARDVVIDLVGYYDLANPVIGDVKFIPPVRVLDTRGLYNASGDLGGVLPIGFTPGGSAITAGPITPNAITRYKVSGQSFGSATQGNQITFPANVSGVLAHITTVQPSGTGGYTTLLPGDATLPVGTATLNPVNQISFNSWANGVPVTGTIGVFSTNSQDVIVDVMGYFAPGNPTLTQTFANPVRVVDTRGLYNASGDLGGVLPIGFDAAGAAITAGPLAIGSTTRYMLNGKTFGSILQGNQITLSTNAKGALMNVTIVQSAPSGGFLTIFPGDATPGGLAATVNPSLKVSGSFWGSAISNTTFPNTIGAFSASAVRDLVIDVSAYFR